MSLKRFFLIGIFLSLFPSKSPATTLFHLNKPNQKELTNLCSKKTLGAIVVGKYQMEKHSPACAKERVLFSLRTGLRTPISKKDLDQFDRLIERALEQDLRVYLLSERGRFQAERLIAYYQMKYKNFSLTQVKEGLREKGPQLVPYMKYLWPELRSMQGRIP